MHSKSNLYKIIALIFFLFAMASCKKEDPNPELRDPIYGDLLSQLSVKETRLTELSSALDGLYKKRQTATPHTIEMVSAKRDLKEALEEIRELKQSVAYLKIRSERRRVEGRRSYRIAFEKGEPWPDPEEFKKYELYNKLKTTDLNWNRRVPKLFKENPNYDPKPRKE